MNSQLTSRLALLATDEHRPLLGQGLRGIERETLRVTANGDLARTPHPLALGSALTHPQITTDYAETLLEFITPAEPDIALTLDKLETIHRVAYSKLGDELLWSESMPCALPPEEDIEIAWYGKSNMGMLKHVYRRGLALRYGKAMQCIAGIHYNYSLPEALWQMLQIQEGKPGSAKDFQSESYLALIRNFRRHSWLLMYLFGASPALSRSFLRDREHLLEELSEDTLYLPYATSLRMSDLGYQNDAQSGLTPQENSLDDYVTRLTNAVNKPYPPYEKFGVKRNGEWIQISTNLLQIENEYYSTIRPKRVIRSGERAIQALCARGVQYVEIRCLDVNPFEPIGINLETSRFLDTFLLFCALEDSPTIDAEQSLRYAKNFASTVKDGRRPGLTLQRDGQAITLQAWGEELLQRMQPIAALLDTQRGGNEHAISMSIQKEKLTNPELTPSAAVMRALREHGNSFVRFGLHQSEQHARHFRANPPTAEENAYFDRLASGSLAEQQAIEQDDRGSFDDFVAAYKASKLCQSSN
ncbi:glutamate--cysteine ligase [Undibacterium sp.]|jgi:glutamate--cysteine ligase|uniref:glutamate--cysteine ligase n=1 Tax=Undibacterium sp. TaxID=1914977 RepID=UPI002C0C5320|nr:glutamate--cysteine ligase [Undibacterium sp.]HTD02632.1 glutamate--cysteine ligase [Undibacterium sp.]